jgi:SNF2 family DNA or RNA helicase
MNESDLHDYQKVAIQHIMENTHCGLFLDMGLGKTVSTLTAIQKLIYEELDIDNALVIAPKRVAESVWSAEIDKWDHLNDLKISKIIGTPKQRMAALRVKADIYMLGRDNTAWLVGEYGGNMLPFDMLVVDESSSFKNPKSNRFKALKMAQPSFKRVSNLTGTPAPNGLIDLWSQIYLLDRGDRLGKTITSYRREYFREGQTNGHIVYNWNILKDGESRIHDKIEDICMSMKAEDYLDLEEPINNIIKIQFPKSYKKQYLDFERDQVLEMFADAEEISAVNAAALSTKLQQFANGAIYDEDKNYHVIHDLKLDVVDEIVEAASGKPVLIAYTYKHDLERLMERLKKYNPRKLKTDQDIQDWNDGKIQIMIMHPASGGHGLNLQDGGNNIIWFGQNWSLELYQQFNARLARQGQKNVVVINRLVMEGTVDEDIVKSLERKDIKQEGLMQAVKARIEKYKKYF